MVACYFLGTELVLNVSWPTPEAYQAYCDGVASFFRVADNVLGPIVFLNYISFGVIGLIGSIFLCMVFWQSSFTGPSFIYHKAVAILELVHMLNMVCGGMMKVLGMPGSGPEMSAGWIWYQCLQWGWAIFGDPSKMAITLITLLLSFERCIALWMPHNFKSINRNSIAICACIFSTLIGMLHALPLFVCFGYITVDVSDFVAWRLLSVTKLVAALITIILGALIVLGLKKQGAFKVNAASSNAEDFMKTTKQICTLTLLLAITTSIDNFMFSLWRNVYASRSNLIISFPWTESPEIIYKCLMKLLHMSRIENQLWFVQAITGVFVHCTRFYVYILLHKRVRTAFMDMINRKDNSVAPALALSDAHVMMSGNDRAGGRMTRSARPTQYSVAPLTNLPRRKLAIGGTVM